METALALGRTTLSGQDVLVTTINVLLDDETVARRVRARLEETQAGSSMAFQSREDGQQQAIADHWDGTATDLDAVGASDRFIEGYQRAQAAIADGRLGWMSEPPEADDATDSQVAQ